MGDTKQSVRWTLRQRCQLRPQEEQETPQLQRAQVYGRVESRLRGNSVNLGEICVTSTTHQGIPYSGFLIEKEFAEVGGSTGLREMCGSCPANAALDSVAGCTGWLSVRLYSQELDEQLRGLVEELALVDAFKQAFPPTAMLWFSFWMNSPLSQEAMTALIPLLEALGERSRDQNNKYLESSLQQFVRALERALYFGLDMQVEIMPPGHTTFNLWTIFPHCPLCKAGLSPIAQWGKIPRAWHTCAICFHEFDPATTSSHKRLPPSSDGDDLQQMMSEGFYRDFAVEHLVAQGHPRQNATETVAKFLAPPDPALIEKRRQASLKLREKRRFISTVLCAGFERLKLNAPEDIEERVSSHYLLSLAEAWLLLSRAKQWKAEVHSITHHTKAEAEKEDENLDAEYVHCRDFATPEAALQDLQERGFNELFSISLGVSDAAFEAWKTPLE